MAAPPISERHKHHFHRQSPIKESVRAATTASVTISTALNNGDTLDGVTLATGDRVLVKNQSTGSQNGIYVVGATPVRDYDVSTDDPAFGFLVYVREGTTNGGTLWKNTNTSSPTIDTTSLTFAQISGGSIAATAVSVADSAGYYTGTDVEAVLAELGAKVLGYQAHGNLGSTETFDATAAGWHSGTVNADCTFTFTAPSSGTVGSMVLELTQDGTGGWALTLPGSVVGDFSGYDSTAGTTSLLMFFTPDGGTTWFGFIAGGSGSSVALSDDDPLADGTADPGVSTDASRSDHVHPASAARGALLLASDHATPFTFDEILQASDGSDFLYASE